MKTKHCFKYMLYIMTIMLCFYSISGCGYNKNDLMKRNIISLVNQLEKSKHSLNNPVSRKLFSDALDKLASYGHNAVSTLSEELADSKNANRRLVIIGALAKIGGNGSEKALLKYITDNDAKVRSGVAIGLRGFGSKESSEALIKLANYDINSQVRIAAILSLGKYGTKEAEGLLKTKINDKDPDVQEAAKYSLEKITDKNFVPKHILFPKTLLDREKELDYFESLQNRIKIRLDEIKNKREK